MYCHNSSDLAWTTKRTCVRVPNLVYQKLELRMRILETKIKIVQKEFSIVSGRDLLTSPVYTLMRTLFLSDSQLFL